MEDKQIVDLYWERSESAIAETEKKYGRYCHYIAYQILANDEDAKDGDLPEEYRLHDYDFEYQTENGGEVTIAICSYEEPLRDCFIKCDNPEKSVINGFNVTIYGYQDSFIAQFSYGDVNYDIETHNIKLEELESLLMGITK